MAGMHLKAGTAHLRLQWSTSARFAIAGKRDAHPRRWCDYKLRSVFGLHSALLSKLSLCHSWQGDEQKTDRHVCVIAPWFWLQPAPDITLTASGVPPCAYH